jgi:hypothetical protein
MRNPKSKIHLRLESNSLLNLTSKRGYLNFPKWLQSHSGKGGEWQKHNLSSIGQIQMNLIQMWWKSGGFKTSKVLVSHSKSPSLIFDQRILKLFKIVSGYAICMKLSGSYESLPKTICEWHIFEWEQYKSQIQICRNIFWVGAYRSNS